MSRNTFHVDSATSVVCFLLTLAPLASFGGATGNRFVDYDDDVYITANRQVRAGLTPAGVHWAVTTTHAANWHPLTWLSLQLDASLFGLNSFGFHLTNLLLHVSSTLLCFGIFRAMTGATWASALAAALFGVHPLRVESVAWAAERKDVLSAFFAMLTLWAYWHYVRADEISGAGGREPVGTPLPTGRPGRAWEYGWLFLALALGLLAKPMLVTLPLVLLLLDYWPLGRSGWRRLLLEKLPLLALSAGSCVTTWYAQAQAGTIHSLDQMPLGARIGNSLAAYVVYLGKAIWPTHLAPFYPHLYPRLDSTGDAFALVAVATSVLGILTILVFRTAPRHPYLLVGWLWYVGMLAPVIGLVQVGRQGLADRYTYLPSIGLAIIAAWGLAEIATRWHAAEACAGLAVIAVAACCVASMIQVRSWYDTPTLWRHTLGVTSENYLAHYNLGEYLDRQGQHAEAAHEYQAALAIRPQYAEAHDNLGLLLQQQGDVPGAVEHFSQAIRCDPTDPYAHNNLGQIRVMQGDSPSAAAEFEQAARLKPDFALAYDNLAVVRELLGDPQAARQAAANAVGLAPDVGKYRYDLAHALAATGDQQAARDSYAQAMRLDPRWALSAEQTAWALATAPDARQRNSPLAIRLAEQAVGATAGNDPTALDTLAAAYASAGRFPEAITSAQQALEQARTKCPERVPAIEARLRLYQAGKAFVRVPGSDSRWASR